MDVDVGFDSGLREYTWTLLVLLYFAASDGAIKAKERETISNYFKRRNPSAELDEDRIIDLLKNFGRPDKTTFHRLVRERTAEAAVLQDVYDTAWEIIRTNSKAHTEQERAIEYLKKSWKEQLEA